MLLVCCACHEPSLPKFDLRVLTPSAFAVARLTLNITTALSAVSLVSANSAGALGDATATLAGIGLEGIGGTVVVAIRGAVAISVSIDVAATALAGRDLVKIVGTAVVTVEDTVAICVDVGHAASTHSRIDLVRIVGATIGFTLDAHVGTARVGSAGVSSVGAAA